MKLIMPYSYWHSGRMAEVVEVYSYEDSQIHPLQMYVMMDVADF